MITVYYAFQACDTASNQNEKRYCGDDRTLLGKKSLVSLLDSISYCIKHGEPSMHYVKIFADNCSDEYIEFMVECIKRYPKIVIELSILDNRSLMKTVEACWKWMGSSSADVVYQVQDDYIFANTAIWEMLSALYQIMADGDGHHCIVIPYNNPYYWLTIYRYASIPLMIFPSKKRYWARAYDIPCTFMTTREQFNRHWDIYNKFLSLPSTYPRLEPETLNKIMTERNVLCVQPIESIALHMQAETEKDPFIDWQSLWNSIDINTTYDERS